MNSIDVVVVRVYITEASGLLDKIVNYLKQDVKIRGVSVFRATRGYGDTGGHNMALMDLSLDLPLAIEFFDCQEKIDSALDYLNHIIKLEHIIFWAAKTNS